MKYVILDISEISTINFSKVLETSIDTLRFNNANTHTFVKFEGETPDFLEGKTQNTYEEIMTILTGSEWTQEEEE